MKQLLNIMVVLTLAVLVVLGLTRLVTPLAPGGGIARLAWACGSASLGISLGTAMLSFVGFHNPGSRDAAGASIGWYCALFLGVGAGILQTVLLVMRCVYVLVDLINGYPWNQAYEYGFQASGLWTIAALTASCLMALVASRDARLVSLLFWNLVFLVIWACLLAEPYQPNVTGGIERSESTLLLVECLSALLLVSVFVAGWLADFRTLRAPGSGDQGGWWQATAEMPPGFRSSVTAVALALHVAIAYHVLVPTGQAGPISSSVRAGLAGGLTAWGCVALLRRCWGYNLADVTLGVVTLAAAGVATGVVPSTAGSLGDRYPMVFNAILVGAALTAALWVQLAWQWSSIEWSPDSTDLRCRFVPHLKRFAFFSSALALLSALLMSFWPGMAGISTLDNSLGRVLAGLAAFLLLLLVTLRSARLLKRISFHLLGAVAASSMVSYLVLRAAPFTSR